MSRPLTANSIRTAPFAAGVGLLGALTLLTLNGCGEDADAAQGLGAGSTADSEAGSYQVEVLEVSPAPPEKGVNEWTLRFTDADGEPMQDMELTVEPWMPDHGHGARHPPELTMMEDGKVRVSDLLLHMGGLWEVYLRVNVGDGTERSTLSVIIED